VKNNEIKHRWQEYFNKLFNGENGTAFQLDDSLDDTNKRIVHRIQESDIRAATNPENPLGVPLGRRSVAPHVGGLKAQRWSDTSPVSSSGDSWLAPQSYKEALLAYPLCPAAPPPAPRVKPISLVKVVADTHPVVQSRRAGPRRVDDGWQVVRSKRRKFRGNHLPRREPPVDLRGRCFNCFSSGHLASVCRRPTRCFQCLKPGHQAARCPGRLEMQRKTVWQRLEKQQARGSVWQRFSEQRGVSSAASKWADSCRRRSVWVRINTPEAAAMKEDTPRMADDGESHRSLRNKRKRRRSKHGKGSIKSVVALGQASSASSDEAEPPMNSQTPVLRPSDQGEMNLGTLSSCILEFSDDMAREEANLRRALFVTIVGTRPIVKGSEVVEEVAHSFNVKIEDMKIHQTKPEDFLLLLPDEATGSRVVNGGKILRGPRFSLIFKRWTRCSHASSSIMSGLVDLEIRGIPEHAWSLSTVKSILIDSCWIAEVHPDTLHKQDLSSFVIRAWCFNPEKLQRVSDLHIIEPGLQMFEKRCLTYKIQVRVLQAGSNITPADPLHPWLAKNPQGMMTKMKFKTPILDVRVALRYSGGRCTFAWAHSRLWVAAPRRLRHHAPRGRGLEILGVLCI
jgi:hypothetical protein